MCMSGAFWAAWGLAARNPNGVPSSATRKRCAPGGERLGLLLKKSCPRQKSHRLHRRIGTERASHAGAHLGAQGANAHHPVSLQLETRLGDRRADPHELPVSLSRWLDQESSEAENLLIFTNALMRSTLADGRRGLMVEAARRGGFQLDLARLAGSSVPSEPLSSFFRLLGPLRTDLSPVRLIQGPGRPCATGYAPARIAGPRT